MATLGSTSEPTTHEWSGGLLNNQVASALTFPAGGPWRITKVACWLAGKDGAANIKHVIWNSSRGSVLGQSGTYAATSRSFGNIDLYNKDLVTPVVVAGGTTIYAGFWRNTSDTSQWGVRTTGSHYDDTEGSGPAGMSGETLDSTGSIGVYVTYEADNVAPNAPSLTLPANAAIVAGVTPTFAFTHSDPNGDALLNYDIQVSTDNTFASVTHWNAASQVGGISGNAVSIAYGGSALTRGTTYYWRTRTRDPAGLVGAYSTVRSFIPNALPTYSSRVPGAAALAKIWNLGSDLQVWTAAGSFAKPRVSWIYSDPGGQGMTAYRVKLWNDSAGSKGSQLSDTGKVVLAAASGSLITVDLPTALVAGTQYWWSVEVWDSLDESSGSVDTSTATAFKVRFAQGIYEFNAGAGSSGWDFANTAPSNGDAAFLFATATAAAGVGRGAWATDIGSLVPAAYLNVLVRLAPAAAGTNVLLPDMTFSYLGSASTPDRMQISGSGASMSLDPSVRRFGTKSLKVVTGAAVARVYPFVLIGGVQKDLDVLPTVRYTLSLFVKSSGVIATGLRLIVYQEGTFTTLLDGVTGLPVIGALTTDTASFPDGWQRLTLTFTVPPGAAKIRPAIEYAGTTAGKIFWIDAWQLEEGLLASQWRPGAATNAAVMDANGLMIDGSAGGILRARGGLGGVRDLIEIGDHSFLLGGDTPLYSPATSVLRIDDALRLNADLQVRRAAAHALAIEDDAGGVALLRFGGNAFPASPTAGDLAYRKDLGCGWWEYDGTRWRCTTAHELVIALGTGVVPVAATASFFAPSPGLEGGSDIWLVAEETKFFVSAGGTALGASHKWVGQPAKSATGGSPGTNIGGTINIDSGTSGVWRHEGPTAIGALMNGGTVYDVIATTWTKTGTPGTLYPLQIVTYNHVAT